MSSATKKLKALKGIANKKFKKIKGWGQVRTAGKEIRKEYSNALRDAGETNFREWSNKIYEGLLGKDGKGLRKGKLISGDPRVARNYVPETTKLKAVNFTEDRVIQLLKDGASADKAHEDAIAEAREKFEL